MKCFVVITYLFLGIGLSLFGQANDNPYFKRYFEDGEKALKEENFVGAIKSFRGALGVDNLETELKNRAARRLKKAFEKYDEQLKAERDKARRNEKIATKNQKIAEARRLAFLSKQEQNDDTKLNLVFFAKILLDTQIQAVNEAFNEAVQLKYEDPQDSLGTFGFVYEDSLIITKQRMEISHIHSLGKNNYITTSQKDFAVQIFNQDGQKTKEFQHHLEPISHLATAPDNSYFLTGSMDGKFILNYISGEAPIQLKEKITNPHQISFSPDSKTFVLRTANNFLTLWDKNGDSIKRLEHKGRITAVSFFGEQLITLSTDGKIKIWNGQDGSLIKILDEHKAPIYFIDINQDTTQFLTFDANRKGILWNKNFEIIKRFPKKNNLVNIQFTPFKNRWLYRFERALHLVSERDTIVLGTHDKFITGIAFSPDNNYILSWSQDKKATLWTYKGKDKIVELKGFNAEIKSGSFSPNGDRILVYDYQKKLIICPVPHYELIDLWTNWKSNQEIINEIKNNYNISVEPNLNKTPIYFNRNIKPFAGNEDFLEFSEDLFLESEREKILNKNSSKTPIKSNKEAINHKLKAELIENQNSEKLDSNSKVEIDTHNWAKGDLKQEARKNISLQAEKENLVLKNSVSANPPKNIFFITKETSFRNGPNHTFKSISRFRLGTEVTLLEETNKNWWKINYNGRIGWVKSACIIPIKDLTK